MVYEFPDLKEGIFLERLNRFAANVEHEGNILKIHVPNSGRMKELLFNGARVWFSFRDNPGKTVGTLWLTELGGNYIILHSTVANKLFEVGIKMKLFDKFSSFCVKKSEYTYNKSRFDFLLEDNSKKELMVEVKSVNLVVGNKALFPDAPTQRGVKHLNELITASSKGVQTAVVFMVMRDDASVFSPNLNMHKEFADTLKLASENGVMCACYKSSLNSEGVIDFKEILLEI